MTTKAELDERYGRTRRGRRAGWITIGAFAALAVGWLTWTTVASTIDDVGVDDLGFEVVDERAVEVSFQFTAPLGRDVVCVLEALDEDFGVVGWKVFEYPATESHAQQHRETVPTVAEATTGLVNSCRVS
ncbi:DUF4307 domain-containing protein [Microbacterium sp. Marseille-Q6965]|uniref:DUF4307 domain-containing protein n=1 Tax=Microbacterium sp. Marseille-Q6965 TaxID=2965072 RepID=UPI0021B70164|nr:DUF4307 domain-containing protein [Microbacterium sp. Marseille-Q6965]